MKKVWLLSCLLFLTVVVFCFKSSLVVSASQPSDFGLKEGDLISAIFSDDPDVYIINEHGFKRLFLNPEIFKFYTHLGGFFNVKLVTKEVVNTFPTSGLFRDCESNDQRVYGVDIGGEDTGQLHWVNTTGEQAVKDDPDFFKKVFCINKKEFDWYPKGNLLNTVKDVPDYERMGESTTSLHEEITVSSSFKEVGQAVICHYPPGDPSKPETLAVGASAVKSHLAHGDTVGSCSAPSSSTTPVPTLTPAPSITPTVSILPNPVASSSYSPTPTPATTASQSYSPTPTPIPTPISTTSTSSPTPTPTPTPTPAVTSDTTQPSTPTGLSVTVISSSQINLSWNASTDNVGVEGYKIYRNGAIWYQVTKSNYVSSLTAYSSTGLSPNTSYSYYIKAFDSAGNLSSSSDTVSATTQSGASTCSGLNLTFQGGKSSYVIGETITYTYSCTPSGTASYVEIQVVKPDGSATTYNSASGSISTNTLGFGTSNLVAGSYTLRACFSVGCSSVTASSPFTVAAASTPTPTPATSSVSFDNFSRNLAIGSRGNDVKQLQALLVNEVGYSTNLITGYFGSITQNAVKKLQEKYGIKPAYGYFGSITRKTLNALMSDFR
ncbi:MAG: peptidoglycan-binding protein [bacterium]|nr:peptidoglycan-binding protein [bacterium]